MTTTDAAAENQPGTPEESELFDAVVVGTGFGGSVTACRLVEAGFRICVLERGRRYGPDDFPKYPTEDLFASDDANAESFAPPPDFSRWLWSGDHGLFDIRDLDDAMSVQAAGYGGGSLIYANVHLRPPLEVFEHGWPDAFKGGSLNRYFDLAAYMLRVTPVPKRLAKTLQLKRVADVVPDMENHWFRTPLAVTFDHAGPNPYGREQQACDMRGRCCQGCDHRAKNTLDMNYLARAEDGAGPSGRRAFKPDIRTLAEVTVLRKDADGFTVTYNDLLLRDHDEGQRHRSRNRTASVRARHVFLCAGSVATTELLFKNPDLFRQELRRADGSGPLGSHYFPNADSFSVVLDCDEPHEADYGPTITAALLYQRAADGIFSRSLDFCDGFLAEGHRVKPHAGIQVRGGRSRAMAELSHDPILDWGSWKARAASDEDEPHGAVGALPLIDLTGDGKLRFEAGEPLTFVRPGHPDTILATATARSVVDHTHWFLAEDGGYAPDLEPLAGIFQSPLWLRRNRWLERTSRPIMPLRRPPSQRLRIQAFADAISGTARRAASTQGLVARTFDIDRSPVIDRSAKSHARSDGGGLVFATVLGEEFNSLLPDWFVTALDNDRSQLFEQAAALALPLLGRLLDDLATTVVKQIDRETLARLGGGALEHGQLEVLIRGMLRQGMQIVAGSEAAVATEGARLLLDRIPRTPGQLLEELSGLLLWALSYGTNEGHTGVLLTMGRDLYRGRLTRVGPGRVIRKMSARLPDPLLDTSAISQEQLLRAIASGVWHGELRTNPAWTALDKRVTVHSQGGCPMGSDPDFSVTDPHGQVHGCEGLYVMDAAAFPTSVGVNPSATITAVAEFKVEQFIRRALNLPAWQAADTDCAAAWLKHPGRRAEIDPLNSGAMHENGGPNLGMPDIDLVGLEFDEKMSGFLANGQGDPTDWDDLEAFPDRVRKFTTAEDQGAREGLTIKSEFHATIGDLARLISSERTVQPPKIPLAGQLTFSDSKSGEDATHTVSADSFLQFFVRPEGDAPLRFFRYHLRYLDDRKTERRLDALKVLSDAPGFDLWHDTSTLYFEIGDGDPTSRSPVQRGILRVSIDQFLREQMHSIEITGTTDAARKSWALAAFYKYFGGELRAVYSKRADTTTGLLRSLLTSIHV